MITKGTGSKKKSVSTGLTASRAKAAAVRKNKRAARVTARGAKKANKLNARAGKVVSKSTAKANKISTRKITAPKAEVKLNVKKSTPKVAKTITKVKTARGTGNTYKSAWEANKGGVKKKYKSFADFKKAAVDYNKKKDAKKRAAGGNAATKNSLTKDRGTKGGKPGKPFVCSKFFKSSSVYKGLTLIPSGVSQSRELLLFPFNSFIVNSFQSFILYFFDN